MRIETHPNHEPNSRSSLLIEELSGLGGLPQKFKRSQDLIVCGQKFDPVCQKQLTERTSSNDQSRNRSSTMRKLRDINFNDLDDKEFEKAMKKARGKTSNGSSHAL